MMGSSSIYFDEYQNLSSDTSDEPSSPQTTTLALRVPSSPILDKNKIRLFLMPFRSIIQFILYILMFRNPAQYAFILVNVEVIFFIIHYFNFGFLECTMFILFLVFFGKLVYIKNETFFVKYIKKESLEKDESDELVDKFTYFLSTIGSRIHCFYLACKQKGEDDSLVSRIIWLWFLSCLFLLTKIISTYSFFFHCYTFDINNDTNIFSAKRLSCL